MGHLKIEPRLEAHIDQEKIRASAGGMSAAAVDDIPIPVTISHGDVLRADGGMDGMPALSALGEQAQRSQRPVMERLEALHAPEVTTYTLANAMTTRLTPRQIQTMAEMDEVRFIRLESTDMVTCMQHSAHAIEARDAASDFSASGRGIKVAILDSGVDANHPALLGKVVGEISTTPEAVNIPGNHGTHVAGTVASNDPVHRGIAPQADLINIKVLTAAGGGQPGWVIQGLEQAVRRGALVANLSLGWSEVFHGWVCDNADCILCEAADNAVRLGVTVVVAAGNEANAGAKPPFAIRHPGAARNVITVGAVDNAKMLAAFSSLGPGSGRLGAASPIRLTKPDLSAPGVAVMSSVLGGGFAAFSGTSMASPHVAGLAALVLEKNRALTPRMVKKLLEDSCERVLFAPNQTGYGIVNAYSALLRATAAGSNLSMSATT